MTKPNFKVLSAELITGEKTAEEIVNSLSHDDLVRFCFSGASFLMEYEPFIFTDQQISNITNFANILDEDLKKDFLTNMFNKASAKVTEEDKEIRNKNLSKFYQKNRDFLMSVLLDGQNKILSPKDMEEQFPDVYKKYVSVRENVAKELIEKNNLVDATISDFNETISGDGVLFNFNLSHKTNHPDNPTHKNFHISRLTDNLILLHKEK